MDPGESLNSHQEHRLYLSVGEKHGIFWCLACLLGFKLACHTFIHLRNFKDFNNFHFLSLYGPLRSYSKPSPQLVVGQHPVDDRPRTRQNATEEGRALRARDRYKEWHWFDDLGVYYLFCLSLLLGDFKFECRRFQYINSETEGQKLQKAFKGKKVNKMLTQAWPRINGLHIPRQGESHCRAGRGTGYLQPAECYRLGLNPPEPHRCCGWTGCFQQFCGALGKIQGEQVFFWTWDVLARAHFCQEKQEQDLCDSDYREKQEKLSGRYVVVSAHWTLLRGRSIGPRPTALCQGAMLLRFGQRCQPFKV